MHPDEPIHLTLPLPPTHNQAWKRGRGRTYLTKAHRRFREKVGIILAGRETITGPVGVRMDVYLDRRGSDLDNRRKPLNDALEKAGIIDNDAQICEDSGGRYLDPDDPRAEVTIYPVDDPRLLDAWKADHRLWPDGTYDADDA